MTPKSARLSRLERIAEGIADALAAVMEEQQAIEAETESDYFGWPVLAAQVAKASVERLNLAALEEKLKSICDDSRPFHTSGDVCELVEAMAAEGLLPCRHCGNDDCECGPAVEVSAPYGMEGG